MFTAAKPSAEQNFKPSLTSSTMHSLEQTPAKQLATHTDLLKQVIEESKKNFVPGAQVHKANHQKMLTVLMKNSSAKKINYSTDHLQLKDYTWASHFDASHIRDTRITASAGPSFNGMGSFIKDVLLDQKNNIQKIIALGLKLTTDVTAIHSNDFYDYCSGCQQDAAYGSYQVHLQRTHGNVIESSSQHRVAPQGIIHTTLTIRDKDQKTPAAKSIDVTLIPLRDMHSISLGLDAPCNTQLKEVLFKLFQETQNHQTLIHCAAGLGRTGHLILTFEIMREYDRIFASRDAALISAEIHKTLNRLRENRPALVFTEDQFIDSIINADILYRYGLEKSLTKEAQPQPTKGNKLFDPLSQNKRKFDTAAETNEKSTEEPAPKKPKK